MGYHHSRATSQGTRRGISGYWARYDRSKNRFKACPNSEICRAEHKVYFQSYNQNLRRLLVDCCSNCYNQEGYIKASRRQSNFKSFDSFLEQERYDAKASARRLVDNLKIADRKQLSEAKREIERPSWHYDDYVIVRGSLGTYRRKYRDIQEDAGVEPLKDEDEERDFDAIRARVYNEKWINSIGFRYILIDLRLTLILMDLDPGLANLKASPWFKRYDR